MTSAENGPAPRPEQDAAATDPQEWLTQTQVARRVVELGLAASMTRQRVDQLARTDPNWPVPKEQWRRVGVYWQLPWPPLEPYFRNRQAAEETGGRPKVLDADMLALALKLREQGVPVPQIAQRLTITAGKNAGKHPSVPTVYRALTEAASAALPREPADPAV